MTWGPAVSSLKQAQPGTSALKTAGLCAVGPGGLEIGLNLLMGQRTPESSEQLVLGEPYNFRSEKQVSFLLLVPKSPHPIYLCVCVRACVCMLIFNGSLQDTLVHAFFHKAVLFWPTSLP